MRGNAWDSTGTLDLVEQSEASSGVSVVEAMGDTAYGDGGARQAFADAGRKLVARVPGRPNSKRFPKDDFVIDLMAGTCTCPAGQVTGHLVHMATRTDLTGRTYILERFRFDGAVCGGCPLRPQCTDARAGVGRTVRLHPQEGLLQEARQLQDSPAYDQYRHLRVVAEHCLARLVQLGIRQARYFGHAKTKFQLHLAATVANLTLFIGKYGRTGDQDPEIPAFSNFADAGANFRANLRRNLLWTTASLTSSWLPVAPASERGFRLNFKQQHPDAFDGWSNLPPARRIGWILDRRMSWS